MKQHPTPVISREKNWSAYDAQGQAGREVIPAQKGNPDLKVGDTHKIRIRKDNAPPARIYDSTIVAVYDNYYVESVETVPKTKTREAMTRLICFPKVDHRFGIHSCDLSGEDEDEE